MPTYEYRCDNDHTFEVIQSMSDDPVASCEVCGEPVQRVFHPVAVHFKGSGFYSTDYGKKRSGGGDGGSSKEDSSSQDSSKSDSGDSGSSSDSDSKKSDTKSESKKTDSTSD